HPVQQIDAAAARARRIPDQLRGPAVRRLIDGDDRNRVQAAQLLHGAAQRVDDRVGAFDLRTGKVGDARGSAVGVAVAGIRALRVDDGGAVAARIEESDLIVAVFSVRLPEPPGVVVDEILLLRAGPAVFAPADHLAERVVTRLNVVAVDERRG